MAEISIAISPDQQSQSSKQRAHVTRFTRCFHLGPSLNYPNILLYAARSLSFLAFCFCSTSRSALVMPASPGTASKAFFKSFSASSSSFLAILPSARRYKALPCSAGVSLGMAKARVVRDTARPAACGEHFRAAKAAFVKSGIRLMVSLANRVAICTHVVRNASTWSSAASSGSTGCWSRYLNAFWYLSRAAANRPALNSLISARSLVSGFSTHAVPISLSFMATDNASSAFSASIPSSSAG